MSGDAFGPLEHIEPDYDTAAQAAMVLGAAGIALDFRDAVIELAEKYAKERAAELAAASGSAGNTDREETA